MALKISEEAAVQMPMKTVASLIALVAIGTWAFFGIQEKLRLKEEARIAREIKIQILPKEKPNVR